MGHSKHSSSQEYAARVSKSERKNAGFLKGVSTVKKIFLKLPVI
jgi:hypothetical protein